MIRTLKTQDELQACRTRLKERGLDFTDPKALALWRLPYKIRYRLDLPSADPIKSWDVLHAIELIEEHVPDRDAPILDMGCFNSEVVYGLQRLGYRQVHGCDLNPSCRWMPYWNKIKYRHADLTKTPYADHTFGAITCLSVVEHGVPLDPFADEVTRLLKPGGLFLFTTDFDATGQTPEVDPETRLFGQPWTIFNPESLTALIDRFKSRGFRLARPDTTETDHAGRPIGWQGREYTFAMVGLIAPG